MGVPRFSLLCTLRDYSDPWYVVLDTVGTHELFLELISAGSWYLYLLDITRISRQGQTKMMQPAFGMSPCLGWARGEGGTTEAHFQQSR